MAEPIGLASGLLTLVIFAHKSCLTLHTTIQGYKNHPKRVRDLIRELETLISVLESLTDTVKSNKDVNLSILDLPLLRCGKACDEFLQELQKCCLRSGGDRRSFRDWTKLTYMGDNIDDFKDSLAAYQSTITIALMEVQTRKSSVTLERLQECKGLIETTTNDLEARLETIDEKLEALIARTAAGPEGEASDLQRVKDERSSTKKCLLVCAQFSKLIEQLQPTLAYGTSQDPDAIPEKITNDGIEECRISIEKTTARLEGHMQELLDQMVSSSGTALTQDDASRLARLREEWESTRQCRDICHKMDLHMKNNISVIDNHITGNDAVQFLVSNSQKTIHGKNQGFGDYIRQVGGHLNDESMQRMSSDFSQMNLRRFEYTASPAKDDSPLKGNDGNEEREVWRPQYGSGRKLDLRQDSSSGADLKKL